MIIRSLLDTDLYKFTMMQVVLHHFPGAQVEYRFKCRNAQRRPHAVHRGDRGDPRGCARCGSRCASSTTCAAGASSRATSSTCWACSSSTSASSGSSRIPGSDEIDITIKGPWLHTILFEVPVLAIVSEVYYRKTVAGARLRRRPQPAGGEDRADERGAGPGFPHRRLRHAAALLAHLAGGSRPDAEDGHRAQVRRHEQRRARDASTA